MMMTSRRRVLQRHKIKELHLQITCECTDTQRNAAVERIQQHKMNLCDLSSDIHLISRKTVHNASVYSDLSLVYIV